MMENAMFCYQCQETAGCTGVPNSGYVENHLNSKYAGYADLCNKGLKRSYYSITCTGCRILQRLITMLPLTCLQQSQMPILTMRFYREF